MKLIIYVKPLSVNDAFRGKHFPTTAKKQFELAMRYALPAGRVAPGPYYRVTYDFYLRNFAQIDYDNCIKVLQDCIVQRDIIDDDRLIIEARIRKFPADKDRVEVGIEPADLPAKFKRPGAKRK